MKITPTFGPTPILVILNENLSHQEWLANWAGEQWPGQPIINLNDERGEHSLLSVELVREFIGQASLQARHTEPLTYLLLHLERASTESQNALLKILEEPPAGLQIVLSATDLAAVLPTIISRCKIHKIHQPAGLNISANSAEIATKFPFLFWEKASYGEIIALIDTYLSTAVALQKETVAAAEEETKTALEKRICRQLLLELTQNYQKLFPQIPLKQKIQLLSALELFQTATLHLQANVSSRLVLENIFFTLKKG